MIFQEKEINACRDRVTNSNICDLIKTYAKMDCAMMLIKRIYI